MADEHAKKNDEFGRLLTGAINSIATYEGKTAPIVEQDLGHHIGLSGASIQRYKRGHVPPEPRTVRLLAEAAIKRGYLGRRWLTRFLHTAAFPSPDAVLDELCPATLTEASSGQPLQNLPPPSYAQFVRRDGPFNEILDALRQRSAVVVIASLGGMGKTSLVREVAAQCLQPQASPAMDAVVWISDAERPGFTRLDNALDEIARTLGYDGLVERSLDEKRRGVEQRLRSQRVLVVVDNFETVTDADLLRWLLKLPEPSKAILTTREYRREFRQGAWPVELRGMSDGEATAFIAQRLRWLRMEHWITDPAQLLPLIETTGGNPKAIEMALGSVKYGHRSLQDVVDDLHQARGSLFEDLFAHNWSMLDEAARRVLLAATFFVPSADGDALAASADVRSTTFSRAVEKLNDLSLLDVLHIDPLQKPRYALHPMVRAFAEAELRKEPAFEAAARGRWLDWYVNIAAGVGYCRDDLKRLQRLDPERDMVHIVAAWARQFEKTNQLLTLVQGSGFYCYVRGLMGREPNLNLLAAKAAQALGQPAEALKYLSHHAQRQARMGNLSSVDAMLAQMEALARQGPLPPDVAEPYRHALASYYFASDRFDEAEREWRSLLETPNLGASAKLITVKWLADCLRLHGNLGEAQTLLEGTLAEHDESNNPRAIVALKLALAKVFLAHGQLHQVSTLAAQCSDTITANNIERHRPDVLFLTGSLAEASGAHYEARTAYAGAMECFQQLGLRREFVEAEAALRRVNRVDTTAGRSEP